METTLDDLQKFFDDAYWPHQSERRPTFFSIARFPHYENVISNIYSFFFDANGPHKFGSLCIDAIIDVLKAKHVSIPWLDNPFKRAYSLREVSMNNSQRLDILIHNGSVETDWQQASAAILIENKIYHWLANDLDNYWNSVNLAQSNEQKIGVVLGLNIEKVPKNWTYISHSELAESIEHRLGSILYRAEPRYVTLLLELIENIHTMSSTNKELGDLLNFFSKNRNAIIKAEKIREQIFNELPDEINRVLSSKYNVWWNKESTKDGWLVISIPGKHRCKYILGYCALFYADEPNQAFHIELHAEADDKYVKDLQSLILSSEHAQSHCIKADNSKYHHIVKKDYNLSLYEYANLPKIVAQKLRDDWFPLESYWLVPTSEEQN